MPSELDRYLEDTRIWFAYELKGCHYLLIAHGVALVTSVTLLKEYVAIPQLKGIGLFINIFAWGFIFAAFGWLGMTKFRTKMMDMFFGPSERRKRPSKADLWFALGPLGVSFLLLIFGVIFLASRLAHL